MGIIKFNAWSAEHRQQEAEAGKVEVGKKAEKRGDSVLDGV